jgi:hypothetical protein
MRKSNLRQTNPGARNARTQLNKTEGVGGWAKSMSHHNTDISDQKVNTVRTRISHNIHKSQPAATFDLFVDVPIQPHLLLVGDHNTSDHLICMDQTVYHQRQCGAPFQRRPIGCEKVTDGFHPIPVRSHCRVDQRSKFGMNSPPTLEWI